MKFFLLALSSLNLAACLTLPVLGEYKGGSEQFVGSATGYLHGRGGLSIHSGKGVVCEGTFRLFNVMMQTSGGDGGFHCDDGRTGDFFFTWNGSEGAAFGKDNHGYLFRFHFGEPENTHEPWTALAAKFDNLRQSHKPTTTYCNQYGDGYRCTHDN